MNDEESPKYSGIANDSLSFSPDSKRVAYCALRDDGRKIVVVDGNEFPAYNGSADGMPVWSPDSKHFAYLAATDDNRVLAVVDGKAGQPWDSVIKESFVFSPDSSRFAYVAQDGDSGRVIVDDEAGPRYRNVAANSLSAMTCHEPRRTIGHVFPPPESASMQGRRWIDRRSLGKGIINPKCA